jgi:glycosyltransferase involved in cell wall biosynthesis
MRGVRVVEEPTKGLSQARSTGFSASDGDIVANLDADILMSSAWIPFVLNLFTTAPNLVALSGPYIYHDLPKISQWLVKLFYALAYVNSLISMKIFGTGAILQGGNFVVRRSAMEKIGGYNTDITFYGEDTDIARRLMKVGEVRWTFKLPMQTSGRRLAEEGLLRTGFYYAINYLSTSFRGSPVTKTHEDVRTEKH